MQLEEIKKNLEELKTRFTALENKKSRVYAEEMKCKACIHLEVKVQTLIEDNNKLNSTLFVISEDNKRMEAQLLENKNIINKLQEESNINKQKRILRHAEKKELMEKLELQEKYNTEYKEKIDKLINDVNKLNQMCSSHILLLNEVKNVAKKIDKLPHLQS